MSSSRCWKEVRVGLSRWLLECSVCECWKLKRNRNHRSRMLWRRFEWHRFDRRESRAYREMLWRSECNHWMSCQLGCCHMMEWKRDLCHHLPQIEHWQDSESRCIRELKMMFEMLHIL